jgi:hypothetical protein
MATCAQIQTELDKLESAVFVTGKQTEDLAAAASYNVNVVLDLALAKSSLSRAEAGLPNLRNTANRLSDLIVEANIEGCTQQANYAATLAGEASRKIDVINSAISRARQGIKVQENAAKAEEAAKKQNNAGNGQPGSAGTSSTANDLQEVTVTGKKTPATVNEPGTTPSDGLEEVQVTGKRTPAAVTEPTSGDGLEEVTVTGKRATDPNTNSGLQGQRANTRAQATIQDTTNFEQVKDWRVRLRLSPGADYLYKAPESQQGILKYLNETDGVVFPYTPTITVSYSANYDQINPTHSNYKVLQYTNSSVDSVSISCDFTAQDTREANYLLAVIHFFRSVTKMFYGQDQNPKPGTPPPLVYLFGLGEFQFNAHPLVVTNFNYALPSDVDYIRAGAVTANPGVSREPSKPTNPSSTTALDRLKQGAAQIGQNFLNSILPGGESGPPSFTPSGFSAITAAGTVEPTYVPTKINLQIQCMPIVSRNDVSNRFSVAEYASGKLLRGIREKGGGFW